MLTAGGRQAWAQVITHPMENPRSCLVQRVALRPRHLIDRRPRYYFFSGDPFWPLWNPLGSFVADIPNIT